MKKKIAINIKFFSGIDKELSLFEYDARKGLLLEVNDGMRLGRVLKNSGLKNLSGHVFFVSGERVSSWYRLKEGDEVSCLRPSGGG